MIGVIIQDYFKNKIFLFILLFIKEKEKTKGELIWLTSVVGCDCSMW